MRIPAFISSILQAILYIILYPILVFFLHLKINGIENLKGCQQPYIIAPNHSSILDPFIILVSFYRRLKQGPIYSVTKDERLCKKDMGCLRIVYNKYILSFLGGYPAYSGHRDYKKSLANHIEFIKDGYSVCIFPEGKIPANDRLGEARGGLCFLSQESNAPIVPVVIKGLYKMHFCDFIRRKREVVVTICSPVEIKKYDTVNLLDDEFYFKRQSQSILQMIEKFL